MRVEVRLFAVARQRAGASVVAIDLPEGATVRDLKACLAQSRPELAPLIPSLMIAVESDYAPDDRVIGPRDALAAIPPVSGG